MKQMPLKMSSQRTKIWQKWSSGITNENHLSMPIGSGPIWFKTPPAETPYWTKLWKPEPHPTKISKQPQQSLLSDMPNQLKTQTSPSKAYFQIWNLVQYISNFDKISTQPIAPSTRAPLSGPHVGQALCLGHHPQDCQPTQPAKLTHSTGQTKIPDCKSTHFHHSPHHSICDQEGEG